MFPRAPHARANQEIFRVRTTLEKEIEVLKAKLTKSEMTNKTLKSTLEAKVACPSMPPLAGAPTRVC